jgi:diguanylate cyclase (GGDEF)-like protein
MGVPSRDTWYEGRPVTDRPPPTYAIWAFISLLSFLAAALWAITGGFERVAAPHALEWWLVALGFVLTELLVAHVPFERQTHTLDIGAVPLVVGLVYCAPLELLAARLVALALVLAVHSRQRPMKLVFNLANAAVEVAVAVIVFHAVLGGAAVTSWRGWLACYAATLASSLSSALGVAVVISISLRRVERSASLILVAWAMVLVTTALGVLTVVIIWNDWRGLWIVVVAVAAAYAGFREFVKLRNRYANLELLYRFTASVSGATETDDVLRLTLERSRDLMRAELAELIVALPGGGWMTKRLVGDSLVTEIERDSDASRVESIVLASTSPVLTRRNQRDAPLRDALAARGWHDIVTSPLARDDGSSAVLLVANRRDDTSTFETEDMRVLETFAGHTAIALRVGDLVDRLRAEAADKEFSSLHDSLTGLPNRKMLVNQLLELLPYARLDALVGVYFMDLDRFKEINDTLGHHIGDSLLIEVARRLDDVVARRGILARLGGDEFALVVPGLESPADAVALGRVIEAAIDTPFVIDQLSLEIRVSIGIALAPLESGEPSSLFQHADIAMYAAKGRRTGVEVYDRSIDHSSTRRLLLAGELRQAIDSDELRLEFQPEVSLVRGCIVGFEALARWVHPDFGPVSPEEFVPIAEQSGLIHSLTRWAIRASLEELVRWRIHDPDLRVSVNVSARNLIDASLVTDVRRILRDVGLPGDALTLELTESTVMDEPQRTVAVIDRLRSVGVRFAIDDFGTGYSSLSYLKRLDVDEVKVDRSFVRDMVHDVDLASIVRSTVDLARNLELNVVAEGVEDAMTARMLFDLGCDVVQGFYLAPPLPSRDIDRLLVEGVSTLTSCIPAGVVATRAARRTGTHG